MSAEAEPQGAGKLLIDVGPLLVFFLVNFFAPVPAVLKIFVATGAFMVAMVAAMLFSAIRYRKISPLLWFSGVMVVILGGLTIWLHKDWIIKMKPTFYYALVSGLLAFALATGRPLRGTPRGLCVLSAAWVQSSAVPWGTGTAPGRRCGRSFPRGFPATPRPRD